MTFLFRQNIQYHIYTYDMMKYEEKKISSQICPAQICKADLWLYRNTYK